MATYDAVFVIIDALDEVDESLQWQITQKLESLRSTLRILYTSHPHIANLFTNHKKIEICTHREDLALYITTWLQEFWLNTRVKQLSPETIMEKVIEKANGM